MNPRVALVHDWLTGMRGGEKVLAALCELFPKADLFTLVHVKGSVSPVIEARLLRTSPLQLFPGIEAHYRRLLPFMPWAVGRFDLSGYDFVLSSSHCVAKGVRVPPGTPHLSYCHTPMRYIWDQFDDYFGPGRASPAVRAAMALLRPALRRWDRRTASGVTEFVANSENVRRRIQRHYGRDAAVIHPPVDTAFFSPNGRGRGNFFLMVTALAPYKRVEVAIEAFNRLQKPLVIAGRGPEEARLKSIAGPQIKFLGWVDDGTLRTLYREARALVFPGEEDFGMVPVEAMACGCPVLALGRGGALESVIPGETGLLFPEPTAESLVECAGRLREGAFEPDRLRRRAMNFTGESFRRKIRGHLADRFPGLDFGWAP